MADQRPTQSKPRYGLTVGASVDMPGVDSEEAWRRADEVERLVRNALAAHGVSADVLVNVWDRGDGGPILG